MEDSEWLRRTERLRLAVQWSGQDNRTVKDYEGCAGLCRNVCRMSRTVYRILPGYKEVVGLFSTVRAGQCRIVQYVRAGQCRTVQQDLAPRLCKQFRLVPYRYREHLDFFYFLWKITVRADSFGGNFSWSLKRDPAQQGRFYWLGKGRCVQKRRE
jgi:hypothetical protein